jgi:hypothetical protein
MNSDLRQFIQFAAVAIVTLLLISFLDLKALTWVLAGLGGVASGYLAGVVVDLVNGQ